MKLWPIALIALLLALAWGSLGSPEAQPVAVFISGPDAAAPGRTAQYNVTVTGGFGEFNGTYTIEAFLKGEDLEGAAPLEDTPYANSSTGRAFKVNVTAPLSEQTVELVIEARSSNKTGTANGTSSFRIQVLSPWIITATVKNAGSVEIVQLPVLFYLDERFIGNKTVDRIEPAKEKKVELEYMPIGEKPGIHWAEVRVDLNRDGKIDVSQGEVIARQSFYKESEPINPLYIAIGVAVGLPLGLLIALVIRKRGGLRK